MAAVVPVVPEHRARIVDSRVDPFGDLPYQLRVPDSGPYAKLLAWSTRHFTPDQTFAFTFRFASIQLMSGGDMNPKGLRATDRASPAGRR